MPSPAIAFASTVAAELQAAPINPAWIIAGHPAARNALVAKGTNGGAYTLIWDCTAGTFDWFYDLDETIHVLEGSVLLCQDGGPVRRVGPGDVVFFPKGSTARWVVENYIRKLAFFNHPPPRMVGLAMRVIGRIRPMLRPQPRMQVQPCEP